MCAWSGVALVSSTIHYKLCSIGLLTVFHFWREFVTRESLRCLYNIIRSIRFKMSLGVSPSPA